LETSALNRIAETRMWFEFKVVNQLFTAMGLCLPRLRDVANLISIRTRSIAVDLAEADSELLELALVCFNSYLRASLNARDPRTAYYVLSQYRLVAEALAARGDRKHVSAFARRLQYYGQLAFTMGQPFILEVCAYDLVQLVERALKSAPDMIDDLLSALLELDREIRSESQEESLLGVRRAQIQAAIILLEAGRQAEAVRVIDDLRAEPVERLGMLIAQLAGETESEYWELSPRGINFSYLGEERRALLPQIAAELGLQNLSASDGRGGEYPLLGSPGLTPAQ
jgi:hypothetical protein